MSGKPDNIPTHHGQGEIKLSRYFVLYSTQIAWVALGVVLYWDAFWPSTCTPHNLWQVYGCSFRLPENGGWQEAGLLTWLWATPLLVLLDVARRFGKNKD